MSYYFTKLNKAFTRKDRERSKALFRDAAASVASVDNDKLISENKAHLRSVVRAQDIGKLIMFYYDPKLKKTLPYYDRFPLVIPIEIYKDGFLGLNLHYLPPHTRAALFDQLFKTVSSKDYDKNTRLIGATYKFLGSTSKTRYFRPCVKRYLNNHVRSRFLFTPADQWDFALFLPTARFVGAAESKVHGDSLRMIR